ncbi:MAG: class III cytochrome C [Desulfotalea sp.]|nr:MAG: class III cytochrome C [Desulfotalea sp.]
MNNTPSKLIILCIHLLGCILFTASNSCAQPPPEEVIIDQLADLYQPVVFDHSMHSEMYDCSLCHHTNDNAWQNRSCFRCHRERLVDDKSRCSTCHSTTNYKEAETTTTRNQDPKYHIDIPALKGAWHLLCRNCHVQDDGPTDCQGCHVFTAKGKSFFNEKK